MFTILGSCIAVCLFDEEAGIGGMNHFKLPTRQSALPSGTAPTGEYGDTAMRFLVEMMVERGAAPFRLKAKMFGAAAIGLSGVAGSVPYENEKAAKGFLATAGIPVVSKDTGGRTARRVLFHTGSGMVLVETIQSSQPVHPAKSRVSDPGRFSIPGSETNGPTT